MTSLLDNTPTRWSRRRRLAAPVSFRAARWLGRNAALVLSIAVVALVLAWAVVPQLFTTLRPHRRRPRQQAPAALG